MLKTFDKNNIAFFNQIINTERLDIFEAYPSLI